MVPDKFNMVDMEGIDLIESQGVEVPGLYEKLVESIAQCRYQCLYNWKFDGILIPPTYVEMTATDESVSINGGVSVDVDDVVHIRSLEVQIPPNIQSLTVTENGTYTASEDIDGYSPVEVNIVPPLQALTVAANGEYYPDSGFYGFSEVSVNVEQQAGKYEDIEPSFEGLAYLLLYSDGRIYHYSSQYYHHLHYIEPGNYVAFTNQSNGSYRASFFPGKDIDYFDQYIDEPGTGRYIATGTSINSSQDQYYGRWFFTANSAGVVDFQTNSGAESILLKINS